MELLVAWGAFPLLLSALAVGCGLLVRAGIGPELVPRAAVPVLGFATIVVVGQYLALADVTAELLTPLAALLAITGLAVGRRELGRVPRWGLGVACAVFAVYAAPVVLSGEATFAGYIRLDDTATWLAITDRVMEHGRSLDGLAPSTYEAALAFNLADGYPIGAFLPFGVAAQLAGDDPAWLVQPYMAWLAALLGLALWQLSVRVVAAPLARAAAAFLGAQAALLFGYVLWGGVKEIAAAALVASLAALLGASAAARFPYRSLAALAIVGAALVAVLSAGGAIWLLPPLLLGLGVAARLLGPRAAGARAAALAAAVALLCAPVIAGDPLPPTAAPLDDPDARGNLIEPLDPAQVAGIWPAGDFRLEPDHEALAAGLIAVAALGALLTLGIAARRRGWAVLAYVGGSLVAGAAIYLLGSPWVDAKALATASPAIPFAAALAGGFLLAHRRRVEGAVILVAVAAGVLWSTALAYRDASLAPRDQLEELATIGGLIEGEGPTLLTEYQPYGARHFLRDADPEAVSELRRRRIPLRDGSTVPKGRSADTDALDPSGLTAYRTLVLRRSPVQSRPPGAYRLRWHGREYEVWQRRPGEVAAPWRLGLGGRLDPDARPPCGAVLRLARGGSLVAARAARRVRVALSGPATLPDGWVAAGGPAAIPAEPGTMRLGFSVPRTGAYEAWLRGSVRPAAELSVDGETIGSIRHELNNLGGFVSFGTVELEGGHHEAELQLDGPDLHPGSGGAATALGPLVLSAGEAADTELVRVGADDARSLCGREWDWVELAPR